MFQNISKLTLAMCADTSRLLSFLAEDTVNNAAIEMAFDDEDEPTINWFYQNGTIRNFQDDNLCLDVTSEYHPTVSLLLLIAIILLSFITDGADVNGTPLQVFNCTTGNKNQQWTFNPNFSIQWTGHNKCIDLTSASFPLPLSSSNLTKLLTDGDLESGTKIQVWSCVNGNTNQQWKIEPVSTSNE